MNLDTVDYAFFPFLEESKEFYQGKYSFSEIFTEQALDIAVERVKNGVNEDKNREKTYSPELQFKSYICAKAILTEMNNPVYAFRYFKSEAQYLIQNYSLQKLTQILGISAETVNPLDPNVLTKSELATTITKFNSDMISQYTNRFYKDIEPVELLLQNDTPESIFKGMFMKSRANPTLYAVSTSELIATETVNLSNSRVQDSTVYLSESKLKEYIVEELIKRLAEKYPNPVSDVTVNGDSLEDIIQEKVELCIAQLPKISYSVYESVEIECLPQSIRSIYMRIQSNPSLVTEDEYKLLFHVLYRLGFTKQNIESVVKADTEIGSNYLTDLLSDSNVSRNEELESWSDVEDIGVSTSGSDDLYKSVTTNPVEYYRLREYLAE